MTKALQTYTHVHTRTHRQKIKVYNKGIKVNEPEDIHRLLLSYRLGEMVAPNIQSTEALELEINNFIKLNLTLQRGRVS